jgi:hypothetical protein
MQRYSSIEGKAADSAPRLPPGTGGRYWIAASRGRFVFFGENLGVTNDLAKRIAKLLQKNFGTKPGD